MEVKINKKTLNILLALFLIFSLVGFALVLILSDESNDQPKIPTLVAEDCFPAFRDGGGPFYQPNTPFRENIAPDENDGEKLIVEGYIFNSDCTSTVAEVTLDIWQANESGSYEDEYYRGQVISNEDGYYRFETVVPLGYGEGTAYRPPHIHFKAHYNNSEVVTSQMFFEDVRNREGFNNQYIIDVERSENRLNGIYHVVLPDFE